MSMGGKNDLSPPELLNQNHDLSGFACGKQALDNWLRERALKNNETGASQTYVAISQQKVAGYLSLAAGHIIAEGEKTDSYVR